MQSSGGPNDNDTPAVGTKKAGNPKKAKKAKKAPPIITAANLIHVVNQKGVTKEIDIRPGPLIVTAAYLIHGVDQHCVKYDEYEEFAKIMGLKCGLEKGPLFLVAIQHCYDNAYVVADGKNGLLMVTAMGRDYVTGVAEKNYAPVGWGANYDEDMVRQMVIKFETDPLTFTEKK